MKARILVVDDNPDSLAIMRTILENHGYEVVAAGNGTDGLAVVRSTPVDLVLLDVMMPDMSGIEVLQQIKLDAATGRLPVILVTAKTQDDDLLSGYECGADYYIPKPFTAKQLLYGIELVLGQGGGGE